MASLGTGFSPDGSLYWRALVLLGRIGTSLSFESQVQESKMSACAKVLNLKPAIHPILMRPIDVILRQKEVFIRGFSTFLMSCLEFDP